MNSIYIVFENCDNIFTSKNSKIALKKYVKNLLNGIDEDKYTEVLKNHILDFSKYFNTNHRINFKYFNNDITLFVNIVTDKEIYKNKLKNKYKQVNNLKNLKKKIENEIKIDNKKFNKDKRIDNTMINLYFEAKKIMPDNDIPKPNEILDNKNLYCKKFKYYINNANSKEDMIKYTLLKNEYTKYMSYMTEIPLIISPELEEKCKRR